MSTITKLIIIVIIIIIIIIILTLIETITLISVVLWRIIKVSCSMAYMRSQRLWLCEVIHVKSIRKSRSQACYSSINTLMNITNNACCCLGKPFRNVLFCSPEVQTCRMDYIMGFQIQTILETKTRISQWNITFVRKPQKVPLQQLALPTVYETWPYSDACRLWRKSWHQNIQPWAERNYFQE
jgi:hypothetical protein